MYPNNIFEKDQGNGFVSLSIQIHIEFLDSFPKLMRFEFFHSKASSEQ